MEWFLFIVVNLTNIEQVFTFWFTQSDTKQVFASSFFFFFFLIYTNKYRTSILLWFTQADTEQVFAAFLVYCYWWNRYRTSTVFVLNSRRYRTSIYFCFVHTVKYRISICCFIIFLIYTVADTEQVFASVISETDTE